MILCPQRVGRVALALQEHTDDQFKSVDVKQVPADIFRAYDIRGRVDQALTAQNVYTIALAIGSEAQARNVNKIVVGRDGRVSSPILSQALIKGLLATGIDVIDIGLVPTPVLYFAAHFFQTYSGVMLTGSHNPADYNGLKIMLAKKTLAMEEIQALYQRVQQQKFVAGQGQLSHETILQTYIQRITSDVKLAKPFKLVVDCGNGATGVVAPELFRALGCEVVELFSEVDGSFPNHHPDPSVAENLTDIIDAVSTLRADIGLAFDGDGDRLGVVTNQGQVIWPDRQLMLLAEDVLSRHPGAPIVFDVKCSKHLPAVIAKHGGRPIMWQTGHSILKAKMLAENAPIAGELSGHIFFQERWYGFDDGMYAAARLLEILALSQEPVATIFQRLPDSVNTPELKLHVAEENKFELMEAIIQQANFPEANIFTIDGLRVEFVNGWALIRPSNTTPYLVMRFEADDENALLEIQEKFRQLLLAVDKTFELPF